MRHTFKSCISQRSAFQIFFASVFLALVSSLAIGSGGSEDDKGSSSLEWDTSASLPLTLIWYDAHQLLPRSFETMTAEVNRIFDELGVSVYWKKGRMDEADEEAAKDPLKLNVILHPSRATGWGLEESVMAVTTHREGMKGSVYIFFPEVVGAVGLDSHADALKGPRACYELSRALGRVVAHEVVHVLAPHHPHTSGGLMNRSLARRFLVKRTVHMDRESARVVREELQARRGFLVASGDGLEDATRIVEPSPDRLGWLGTRAQSWRPPPQR